MIHNILAIGSGKGGVGKSTITVNLAISLAKKNFRVGILDADLYGPSIPIMLGLRQLSPRLQRNPSGDEKAIPFFKFGIQAISIGFFLEEARSIVWRGPMLHGALEKMIAHVAWGELDYLLIDLPPGTGDIPLSLSQLLPIRGALIVCTPQEVAMVDAIKAINTFHLLNIPLCGVIENMAGFTTPETGQTYHIFGQGKGQELAIRFQTPFLGSIPLITEIRLGCDEGYPAAYHQGVSEAEKHFANLANSILSVMKEF